MNCFFALANKDKLIACILVGDPELLSTAICGLESKMSIKLLTNLHVKGLIPTTLELPVPISIFIDIF